MVKVDLETYVGKIIYLKTRLLTWKQKITRENHYSLRNATINSEKLLVAS